MNFSLAWQTTRACFIIHMGPLVLLMYLALWALIAALGWFSESSNDYRSLLTLACFPTAFWWAFVSSRLLRILRDMDTLFIPSATQAVASSFLLQFIMTILIPAGLCALLGLNFLLAIATLSAVAAGSLLFMLLPRYLGILMGFMPMALNALSNRGLIPADASPDYLAFILLLAGLLMLLATWCFYRLRTFSGEINSWHTPLALMPDVRNGWGAPGWGESGAGQHAGAGNYFNPAVRTANLGSPRLALRACLGSPFMPLSGKGKLKLSLLLALVYLGPFLWMWFSRHQSSDGKGLFDLAFVIAWISFFGLAITFSTIILRLQSLYSKDNTELAELALLPGWKNSTNARGLLLQVIALHAGFGLLIPAVTVLVALIAFKVGDASIYLILISQFIIVSFLAAAYCLNIICGKKTWALLLALVSGAFFIFVFPQLLLVLGAKSFSWNGFVVFAWLVFLVASFTYFTYSWQQLKQCEHPFLRN